LTTTNNKVENRLSEEGGIEKESTLGISRDGQADPTGEYPHRDNWFNSSVSGAARGVVINDLWMGGSTMGVSFDVPFATSSIYPFNQSNTTPSGHSFEIDDTPGNERILIKHHTGAGVELKQDGSVVVASRSHQVQVVGADHELIVSGAGNLTYNGDLNLTVNGDYNVDVGGTYNLRVGAEYNQSVHGSYLTEVGDVHSTVVRGNKDVRVWGDTFNFHSSDLKVVAKKDIRTIVANDFIVNSGRNVRLTSEDTFSSSAGQHTVISGQDVVVTGATGKIGGAEFHYTGCLYTGPDDDNGSQTVFQGNLVGKALEAWTCNFAQYASESHRSLFATYAEKANFALAHGQNQGTASPIPYAGSATLDFTGESEYENPAKPVYPMTWKWTVEAPQESAGTYQSKGLARMGVLVTGEYSTTRQWWEVWNKLSPYAVRQVIVDDDNDIEDKISKFGSYTYYFNWTPTTPEIRAKLRTMDGANDLRTAPEYQLVGAKCIESLLNENRLHPQFRDNAPSGRYGITRTGQATPTARYGYTLLGNPIERSSKTFTPKSKGTTVRAIVADPIYNPDMQNSPITSSTKLSRSTTVSKFLGAPGSKCSLDSIPLLNDRQDLARQWYLHAWLMEGIASLKEFSSYRLQVTEGYYKPASGIRENQSGSNGVRAYWREPYKKEDGGTTQKSIVAGNLTINELKNQGRAVVYTLYNSDGKVNNEATFDLALYIRDTFLYDQLSLDYDTVRPDGTMSQQLIVVMPKITWTMEAVFQMKVCSYFNRRLFGGSDLVEITSN
jgi:hypothetical protein